MRLKIKCIKEKQKTTELRLMSLHGRRIGTPTSEATSIGGLIDIDELLNEEHPLNAWVEGRSDRDVPEFDPRDRTWAEGELDGVEARDPDLRISLPETSQHVATLPERGRHSATLPDTSRLPTAEPTLRRAATQREGRDMQKNSKGKEKITYARKKKRKVPYQPPRDDDDETLPPESHAPYPRRPVRSDDSTQAPSDDDDDDGAAAGATGAGAGTGHGPTHYMGLGLTESYVPETENQGGRGQGQGQGGYGGQQHYASYDWPPWEPHYGSGSTHTPPFQPPTLPYSDISSSPLGAGGWAPDQDTSQGSSSYQPIGLWCNVPSQSGESSSQQYTPRGIQRGMHDLADSLFGYGCEAMQVDEEYGQSTSFEDESSQFK
jgi:hypothetical protein